MNKLFFLALLLGFSVACKQDKGAVQTEVAKAPDFEIKKFPRKSVINNKANETIKNWPEFNALDASFDAVYRMANEEDLKLVIEDLVEKQKLLEASKYPEIFDKAQIKSRQKVVKTYILKVKGNLEYRIDTADGVIEMLDAYNALRNQFNIIANNTLDVKLILDE